MKLFKITLLIISAVMLLFSCTSGKEVKENMMSTHKFINYESVEDCEPDNTVLSHNAVLTGTNPVFCTN